MMRTLDFLAIEYDQLGTVRTSTGNRSQYAAPGNIYATSDGKWASIAASTQSIFERFCAALELQHLLADPRFGSYLAERWVNLMVPRESNNRLLQVEPFKKWLAAGLTFVSRTA